MNSKYDEIMALPHHVSRSHPQMPRQDRAAQFAPFAALSGYDDAVRETGRLTDDKIELEEGALNELNAKIQLLRENLADAPEVAFTYFRSDGRKARPAYAGRALCCFMFFRRLRPPPSGGSTRPAPPAPRSGSGRR
jgi:hypothetical protein